MILSMLVFGLSIILIVALSTNVSKVILMNYSPGLFWLMNLFIVVLAIGLMEALIFSPEDYKQSEVVRIMYVHVPAAWISLGIFSSLGLLSVGSFIFYYCYFMVCF